MNTMKNFLLVALAVIALQSNLYALKCGDKAKEINGKWKNSSHFQVCYNTVDKRNEKLLKILVFCYPNDETFQSLLPILNSLGEFENIKIALIADNEKDVTLFLENNHDFKFPIIADRRSSALYMAGSLIYPKAFIINYENKIIWDGELIDVLDAVKKFNQGAFNLKNEMKISQSLEKLQLAMRSGDEFKAEALVDEILKLDPVNSAALRMRLFMLEEQGRFQEAYELLWKQKKVAGDSGKIYLLMLDLLTRYSELQNNLSVLSNDLAAANGIDVQDKLTFAWVLLNNFNYIYEALEGSGKILNSLDINNLNKSNKAFYYTVSGGYFYRIGELEKAIESQKKSLEFSKTPLAEKILEY